MMAERVERVTEVQESADRVEPPQRVVSTQTTTREGTVSGSTLAVRIIWYVVGVLLTLLAFRFVLALLGANLGNAFARFIFDVTNPFVAPFFDLFNYNAQYGVSRVEGYTIVAMIVYSMLAFGITKLITLAQPRNP